MTTNEVPVYYIDQDGRTEGPYSYEQLQDMHRKGLINLATLWTVENGTSWKPFAELFQRPAASNATGPSKNDLKYLGMIIACVVIFILLIYTGKQLAALALMALLTFLSAMIYFAPTYIAWRRQHRNILALGMLNFFLGWTVLGWVGSLVWALYKEKK